MIIPLTLSVLIFMWVRAARELGGGARKLEQNLKNYLKTTNFDKNRIP